jgi:hypothetical protein
MSEFSRWLSRRNPRYFVEQEGAPVPPAPVEDAFELAKKRRAELKRQRDAAAAGQPQPPMGQNPPAPAEDAFEAAKKRRAELKKQRDAAAKQQPPTVQPPPMGQQPPTVQLPPTVQPPTVQQQPPQQPPQQPQQPVGNFKAYMNKPEQENKQGGTSQPPTMQPPSPPAAQKTTQTKDDDDEPTDGEFEKMDWVDLANFYRDPEKMYSAFIKKIQQKGGLEQVLKDNINIYWIVNKQINNFKEKKIITSDEAKKLLSTRKDLTSDTRGYLRQLAPDVGGPSDDDIKKADITDLVQEYGYDKEKLYYAFTRKIQLQGFDEAVKNEFDAWHIFNRQKGIFQDIKDAKMIITPEIAQELLKRIDFSDIKFKSELRKFAKNGSYE